MPRLLRSIIAMALTGMTFAYSASTASATTSSPAPAPSGIEVDIIFPVRNATYNITESLPVVFALQNLAAAAALGPFTFTWDIMPWGKVGQEPEPAGIVNDHWRTTFTVDNTTTEPYILVNQTDVQKWRFGPSYPNGSVYALQWGIFWDDRCSNPSGALFFNININSPEPDLKNLTGECPQLGAAYGNNALPNNSTCPAVLNVSNTGNPCAVPLNETMVESISSAVQSLITASASASQASLTPTPSPTAHSIAASSDIPLSHVLAAIFLLMSFQLAVFS